MKKIILSLLLIAVPVAVMAQLEVKSAGNVIIGTNQTLSYTPMLNVVSTQTGGYGVRGLGRSSGTTGTSIGVFGEGRNMSGSKNFGVVGLLGQGSNGSGILGLVSSSVNGLNGYYAGYFLGQVHVAGAFTATSINTTSDIRLKNNIVPLSERYDDILGKIRSMNVIEYTYKGMHPSLIIPDSVSEDSIMKSAMIDKNRRHIGLSAQELQGLFPELVDEGQEGYLSVNYIELVPVLIRAIQELEQKVERLESGNNNNGEVRSRSAATAIQTANATTGNLLYQNIPNPFKEKTTIRFHLADNSQNAAICIFDLSGKMLKKLPISSGETSVTVPGYELGEGMFLYTLMVNGQEIDTKRMLITN